MSTVLVVEDSSVAREVVMKILEREGYNVVGAGNGLEALDCLHSAIPDLVLLDVMMPEMDGMTLLQEMRDEPQYRELPVILLTALSDEARMKKARELGVREYLVKTRFSYDELVDQVGKHVVRH
ncbi:MAG TPA: response regulator [Tepidisphaeraceae bacterium]|jgi:CheY-like chemotaxis protein|nr:response regulator [Tepidisphaeraceae bacterium]